MFEDNQVEKCTIWLDYTLIIYIINFVSFPAHVAKIPSIQIAKMLVECTLDFTIYNSIDYIQNS